MDAAAAAAADSTAADGDGGRKRRREGEAGSEEEGGGGPHGSGSGSASGCDAAPSPAAESGLPPLDEFDDAPRLGRGADADLSALRRRRGRPSAAAAEEEENTGEDGADETYEGPPGGNLGGLRRDERDDDEEEEEERVLLHLPRCSATFAAGAGGGDGFRDAPGEVYVTTRRVFFVASDESDDENDLAIDAGCVSLHAMSREGLPGREGGGGGGDDDDDDDDDGSTAAWHVYCQISGGGCGDDGDGEEAIATARGLDPIAPRGDDGPAVEDEGDDGDARGGDDSGSGGGGGGPTEVYFVPLPDDGGGGDDDHRSRDTCQRLFDALSRLASLNPVYDESDEFGASSGGGGFGAMMAMMAGIGGSWNGYVENGVVVAGQDEDEGDGDGGDEMVFRIGGGNGGMTALNGDGPQGDDRDDGGCSDGVSEAEREVMLRRLDAMLIVPKEYEIQSDDEGDGGGPGGQFDDAEDDGDSGLL